MEHVNSHLLGDLIDLLLQADLMHRHVVVRLQRG